MATTGDSNAARDGAGSEPHIDPRIEAVSEALMDHHLEWLDQSDDEVLVNAEEAARIAIVAIDNYEQFDPEYCRWACHADEQNSVVRLLNEYWRSMELPVELLEQLVALVESTPLDLADMIVEDSNSDRTDGSDGEHN